MHAEAIATERFEVATPRGRRTDDWQSRPGAAISAQFRFRGLLAILRRGNAFKVEPERQARAARNLARSSIGIPTDLQNDPTATQEPVQQNRPFNKQKKYGGRES